MIIELKLTDEEYNHALRLAKLAGKGENYDGVVAVAKTFLGKGVANVKTSLGTMQTFMSGYGGPNGNAPEAGVVLLPTVGEGEVVDIACVVDEGGKLTASVYEDVSNEDYTSQFSITESALAEAFDVEQ